MGGKSGGIHGVYGVYLRCLLCVLSRDLGCVTRSVVPGTAEYTRLVVVGLISDRAVCG